jgi:hypothetical protein
MKKLILTGICFLTISCNQNTRFPRDNQLTAVNNSLQNKTTYEIDNTEIDFIKSSPDKAKILLENEYFRVIEYSLKPGEKDSTHTHPPKTSCVISGGPLRIYPEGEKPFDSKEIKRASEWSAKRDKHYVENIGTTTVTILLTEIKSAH